MPTEIQTGLIYGAVLGGTMAVLTLVTLWWNAEILLREYPPDIRQAHGPMSRRARRQHIVASVVFVAVFVGILVASYRYLAVTSGGRYTFRAAWVHAAVMLTTLNLIDLIVVDWLIGIRLRPRMLILPGTEGLAGYDDVRFHVRGFVIGLAVTLAASPIIAALAWLAQASKS
jgi:hypothetical protein